MQLVLHDNPFLPDEERLKQMNEDQYQTMDIVTTTSGFKMDQLSLGME